MRNCKSVCVVVMICATLVNTQIHMTACDQLYYYLSQLS